MVWNMAGRDRVGKREIRNKVFPNALTISITSMTVSAVDVKALIAQSRSQTSQALKQKPDGIVPTGSERGTFNSTPKGERTLEASLLYHFFVLRKDALLAGTVSACSKGFPTAERKLP